jgi:hypothetical protein
VLAASFVLAALVYQPNTAADQIPFHWVIDALIRIIPGFQLPIFWPATRAIWIVFSAAAAALGAALLFLNSGARKVFLFLSIVALWYLSIGSFLWRLSPLTLADLLAVLAFVVCILCLWYLDQPRTREAFGDRSSALSAPQWVGLMFTGALAAGCLQLVIAIAAFVRIRI